MKGLTMPVNPAILSTKNEFHQRHIGPREADVKSMLKELGFQTMEELAAHVIPKNILLKKPLTLGEGLSEFELLTELKKRMGKNKVMKSLIGMGYAGTITPSPILRNVFENPNWYTAYTPYQPEISQGRLEALLNFQTMVSDLTGMEICNASLLDEGTATAEAVAMAHALDKKGTSTKFLVSNDLHPHILEVLKTRSAPVGFQMSVSSTAEFNFSEPVFAVVLSYPSTNGKVEDLKALVDKAHASGAMVIVSTDLLALTLLTPPGEWGADMVVGNSQRFGVPFGFGGPHAAFLATKDAHKRLLPGRLVGVSVDSQGKRALRLTLQTREQHIRREKATSNICTAQVLLANMASFYAVYHGPKGLKKMAERVHALTKIAAHHIKLLGFKIESENFFDTLSVLSDRAENIMDEALDLDINLRLHSKTKVGFTIDETCDLKTVEMILQAFNHGNPVKIKLEDIKSEYSFDSSLVRKSTYLTHPTFNSHHSETELMRYIQNLQSKDITLTHSMIPLGSCTMKLNAASELIPVSWPEINQLHPFAPLEQAIGLLELIDDLEKKLCDITGFAAVSLQPNSGAQGEYAGLLVIREYHKSRNQDHRKVCLIPSNAHGTNPASAVMVGYDVVPVSCDENGNVDVADLKAKAELHSKNLAALMVTYPSTHGVFEEAITEICDIIHQHGGQVYMDGANMNALVAVCKPGEFGPDVSHMNLHKTFAIPHGGGGPGVGPIGVRAHLAPFLPRHSMVPEMGSKTGVSAVTSAPWGSASILPISWAYISMMGAEGLKQATLISILSANYIAKKLSPHYPILYKGKEGLIAHECILDLRSLKKASDIDVTDVAKRLMDFGFHAPTMSWPVAGTLMVEPTESESKAELDRFIEAMVAIRNEIKDVENGTADKQDNVLKNAPHTLDVLTQNEWKHSYSREKAAYPLPWLKKNKTFATVSRVDNAYGDRNIVCSCPPMEEYSSPAPV
jgi:glycine dehydrogenase